SLRLCFVALGFLPLSCRQTDESEAAPPPLGPQPTGEESKTADAPKPDLPDKTVLDEYLAKPDDSYSWKLARSRNLEGGVTEHVIDMTSQTWLTEKEVDRTRWQHWLGIYVPKEVKLPTALLFIGGGSNGRGLPERPEAMAATIAKQSSAVVCYLGMVPNQPLEFHGDGKGRSEDDLIAYAWTQYLKSGDPIWLPRLPMVKSAVRAMDCVQEFAKGEAGGRIDVEKFVVSGGSKRGWTTWLTGLDPRVSSIIPVVIDVLNVNPSMDHHYAAYGAWSPALDDYVRHRIAGQRGEAYNRLLSLVDPYAYRHRLELPKFIVNASGDQFFLPDSSKFYFDDLIGEKYLRYVPNADHSLRGSDAAESIAAWFLAIATGTERPKFSWTTEEDAIRVSTKTAPTRVLVWSATNPKGRDFRVDTIAKTWTSEVLEPKEGGLYTAKLTKPEKGFRAYFVELEFAGVGGVPLKLTTDVSVRPDVLPHLDDLKKLHAEAAR
ncbi:MAG: PhoPQ-activated pathogenicity-related family protein, partial [Planctomycetota bacterium]